MQRSSTALMFKRVSYPQVPEVIRYFDFIPPL
jgi:hypothetical protein